MGGNPFGTIYKPPDSSKHLPKNFNFFLSKTLQSIDSEKRESIIMGDMNVNYLIENDHQVIKDIFKDNGSKQILNTSTRVTDQTFSLTDLIFVKIRILATKQLFLQDLVIMI